MSLLLLLRPEGAPAAPPVELALGPAPPRTHDLQVTLSPPGGQPRRLAPIMSSLRWTSAAVGGYGSCEFELDGWRTRQEIPFLSTLTLTSDGTVVWEGRVEDVEWAVSGTDVTTRVQAFGWRRLLDDTTVRRVFIKRDIPWNTVLLNPIYRSIFEAAFGAYDENDLTKHGVRISGTADTYSLGSGSLFAGSWDLDGVTLTRLLGTYARTGSANWRPLIWWRDATTDNEATLASTGAFDISLTSPNPDLVLLVGARVTATIDPTTSDYLELYNMRALGEGITAEDASGGVYGGTVLRDLLTLVPDLAAGTIEDGTDFLIQAITRDQRSSVLSAVEEVAGYYQREWGVWENRRFDWRAPNLDEPQWIATIPELSGLNLRGSADGVARTTYLLYTNAAANNTPSEESATTTDQRNPWVKTGATRDAAISATFPMTPASAAQLAAKLANTDNSWPAVTGTITLPADTPITHTQHGRRPAWQIRAGENIRIPDLPTTDIHTPGRDGETFFHIVTSDVSLQDNTVTLELEGQTRRGDILLARLAAATRVVTG